MSRLHQVSNGGDTPQGAVVFVHGLGGDPYGTWQAGGIKENFWPKWLVQDLHRFSIHTLEYDASASNWFGGAMALPDRAANVNAELQASLPERVPIVFVCHSLGGLVVKQLLRNCVDSAELDDRNLAQRTRGVVFAATPNAGAGLASWMDMFRVLVRPTDSIKDMQANSANLLNLNDWYRDNSSRLSIETQAFVETRKTKKSIMVVTPSSANPGIAGSRAIPIDADHFEICKPTSKDTTFYKQVRNFIKRRLDGVEGRLQHGMEAASDSLPKTYDVFISHSNAQKPWVEALARNLLISGHSVFLDNWCLVPGRNFISGLKDGLSASRSAILVVSPESHHSGWVREEHEALKKRQLTNRDLAIIPVIHSSIEGDLPYENSSQWVDFRTDSEEKYRKAFAKLLCGLEGKAPGPYPNYEGPLEFPQFEELQAGSAEATRSVADNTFEALFNTKTIIILAQDGSNIGRLSREIRSRAVERFGVDNVDFIVPTNIYGETAESTFFRDLARQVGLGDIKCDAALFHRRLGEKVASRDDYCLLITGIELIHPDQLQQLAGIVRAIDTKYEQFRLITCGSEKLCDLKYANGKLSYLSNARDIRWPEPGIAEVIEIMSESGHRADNGIAERILKQTGGHLGLIRELCQDIEGGKLDDENLKPSIEDSGILWTALTPLVQDPVTLSSLQSWVAKDDLGRASPFIFQKLLRRLYWLNLITSRRIAGKNRLLWRSPQIQAAVSTIVVEQ